MRNERNNVSGNPDNFTVAPPCVAANNATAEPEFIRLPVGRGARCPFTGLSRAFIYQLINERKIKSVSLRKRGCLRGVRLIHLASLKAYLRRLMEKQEAARLVAVLCCFWLATAEAQMTYSSPGRGGSGVSPQQVSNIVAGMTANFATLAQVGNAVLGSMSVFAPTNLAPPTISGSIMVGSTATASTGVWFSVLPLQGVWCQWLKDGSGIPGETNVSYAISSNDVGSVLAFRVAITNALGLAIATSATTSAVTNAPPPAPSLSLYCVVNTAGDGMSAAFAGDYGTSNEDFSGIQPGDTVGFYTDHMADTRQVDHVSDDKLTIYFTSATTQAAANIQLWH